MYYNGFIVLCHIAVLKLEVHREHRPPPNASIGLIELWQFFPGPNSDADRHQNVIS